MIEAMLVVALLAILAAMALPSFQTMIANNRVSSAASELQVLLLYARSEAVYRRTATTVTSNGTTWEVKAGNTVLRTAGISNAVSLSQAHAAALNFEISGNASNNFTISASMAQATRLECVRITRAGLVQLERKQANQSC